MNLKWSGVILSIGLLIFSGPAVAQKQPEDNPSFKQGLQSYFQGSYKQASKLFRQSVEEQPKNPRYHFFLANTYGRLGRDTMAIKTYQRVIQLDTGHETARRRLGDLYYEKEKWSRASRQYRRIISAGESNINVEFRLARSLFKQGKLDEAKRYFLSVRRKDPQRADVYFYLGRILLNNDEVLNAVSRFDRAIELDNSPGKYYFYRALANFRQEDYMSESPDGWKSATDFQRALDRGYESPRTHFMLGNSLLNRGLVLLKRNQDDRGIDRLKKSIRQFRQVLAGDWNASNAYHNMGVAYLGIGKLEMARKSVEQAILMEPTVPFFHDTLGLVYYRQGEFGKAIDSWQLVKELDSDYDGSPFQDLLDMGTIEEKIKEARIRR